MQSIIRRGQRLAQLTWIWLALFTVQISDQAADFAEPSPLERFKALLSRPPRIERMVYAQTLPAGGQTAPFLETGLAGSTNREFYELRWQPNGMLHRQLTSPDQADETISGQCFSLWNGHFYFLDARTKPALYVLEEEKAKRGVYPGPYHAAHIRMTEAVQPLNLGVSHIYPGAVRWEGDNFNVVTMADKKPNWIRGRITGLSNGIPNELRVQYSNDMGLAQYRIQYEYAGYRAPYYPSRIATHFIRNGKEILYSDCHILSVATADRPLPETHFNLASAIQARDKPLLYLTNDTVYSRLPSGQFIETPAGIPSIGLGSIPYYKNRYYYLAALAWTVAFLLLGLKTWQRTKPNHS